MFRRTRHEWIASRRRAASYHRRLRLEPLEDRQLLSITVNTLVDENDGIGTGGISLRDAIAAASPGETIDFAVTGTITLEHGELVIDKDLSIVGPGADLLAIDANGSSRVFNVDDGTVALSTVAISGLTITGGFIEGDGGGISNAENLTIAASSISGNTATHSGGGVFAHQGSLTIRDNTLSGNAAQYGGGLYNVSGLDFVTTITNSTVSGNTATDGGGGIYNFVGHLVIQHATISNNTADHGRGGGLVSWGDANVTLTEVFSSIIAGNHANEEFLTGTDVDVVGGDIGGPDDTIVSGAYNIVDTGNAVGSFTQDGDAIVSILDLLLGPLADNGGPTQTHALLDGSPAIDTGDDSFAPPPDHDQRGEPFVRVSGARMDIGAFEAEASYFLVDTLLDEVDGIGVGAGTSLRDALAAANFVDVDSAVITFDPALTESAPGTILLTYGQLNVDADVTIAGPGADRLTIDAQGDSRVMLVDNFDGGSLNEVTVRGLTLTGGVHADEGGGGIFNNERLTVRDSVLTGNEARWGGGIYNHTDGELTVVRSTLSGNSALFGGAGVYNWGGAASIIETTVSGNDAADGAGVLNANSGEMLIEASTISGNQATSGNGGGILQAGGLLTIRNSTISGNEADGDGGGIQQAFGPLEIYHSTTTANRADADQSGLGFGGGIFHVLGPTLLVEHTIVAGNSRHAATRDDVAGSFDARYSLFGDDTGASINDLEGSLIGTSTDPIDPLLGSLADNGGPTLTHALLPGSPAIDAGDPSAEAGVDGVPGFDQRGRPFNRVSDGDAPEDIAIDIGAYEVQQLIILPALLGDYNLDGIVDAADYTVWRNTLGNNVGAFKGADGNGNEVIDAGDYQVWKDHYGDALPEEEASGASGQGSAGMLTSRQKMSQIVIAIHNYEDVYKRFPLTNSASWFDANGQPFLSWRVHLLRFLDEGNLYNQFHLDEPWDSPHNLTLLDLMPEIYRSDGDSANSNTTRFLEFTGPGAPFLSRPTGNQFGPRNADITDGHSNTIFFVEAGSEAAVPWTKPVDLPFWTNNPRSPLGTISENFYTAMFDGSVPTRSNTISIDLLSALITHQGQELIQDPPAIPNLPNFFIGQTAGDTVLYESEADAFDVVLDKAPLADVVLRIDVSHPALATPDHTVLTFTPENWSVRHRVTLSGVDDSFANSSHQITVTVSVDDALSDNSYDPVAAQSFSALIRDDDPPALLGDFNHDAVVDGADYTVWRNMLGDAVARYAAADGDGNGRIEAGDYAVWKAHYGQSLSVPDPGTAGVSRSAATEFESSVDADAFPVGASASHSSAATPVPTRRVTHDITSSRDAALLAWIDARRYGDTTGDSQTLASDQETEADRLEAETDAAMEQLDGVWTSRFDDRT